MTKDYVNLIVSNINAETLSYFFFAAALLLSVFYFVRKAASVQVQKIISVKKAKELLVSQLSDSLNQLSTINDKLIHEKEILDSFENDTITAAINVVKNIRTKYGIFNYLNDPELVKNVTFYFDGKLKLLEEMLQMEEGSYKFQIEYHQKLIQYNRDLENLKASQANNDDVIEYKRAILMELDKIRTHVSASLTNLKEKREEYYAELKNSQSMLNKLHTDITNYKRRELDAKRFYPRYLAFA